MKRLLVPAAAPGRLEVHGARAHHLVTVLRAKAGDVIEVFDGRGTSFEAVVELAEPDRVSLRVGEGRAVPAMRRVTVVQGLPKGDKLEFVLQKGTELGASAFLPAPAMRSVAKLDDSVDKKLARWRRIVEEAARQCGRADVPEVLAPRRLDAIALDDCTVLVLDEEARELTLGMAVAPLPSTRPLAIVIGPEGGLDRAEVQALTARGAIAVSLGPLVLRTETAALAALSVIRHLDGVLG